MKRNIILGSVHLKEDLGKGIIQNWLLKTQKFSFYLYSGKTRTYSYFVPTLCIS